MSQTNHQKWNYFVLNINIATASESSNPEEASKKRSPGPVGSQQPWKVKAEVGSKLHDYIDEINMLYPPEIVLVSRKDHRTAQKILKTS